MVKVYSTPTCPWCKKVKTYLESKSIQFVDVNVGENVEERKEMMSLSGQSGVPVINVDGRIIIGFDKEALDEALDI